MVSRFEVSKLMLEQEEMLDDFSKVKEILLDMM